MLFENPDIDYLVCKCVHSLNFYNKLYGTVCPPIEINPLPGELHSVGSVYSFESVQPLLDFIVNIRCVCVYLMQDYITKHEYSKFLRPGEVCNRKFGEGIN